MNLKETGPEDPK